MRFLSGVLSRSLIPKIPGAASGNQSLHTQRLEQYIDEYIAAAGIGGDKKGPLFRTAIGRTGKLFDRSMSRMDAWYMVRRRAKNAGVEIAIGNHSFRAIGITDYPPTSPVLDSNHPFQHPRAVETLIQDRS